MMNGEYRKSLFLGGGLIVWPLLIYGVLFLETHTPLDFGELSIVLALFVILVGTFSIGVGSLILVFVFLAYVRNTKTKSAQYD